MLPLFEEEDRLLLRDLTRVVIESQDREETVWNELLKIGQIRDQLTELKQHTEIRLKNKTDYIESQKLYFHKYIQITFTRLSHSERDNQKLKEEIKNLKEENSKKFEKLEADISDLTRNFQNLNIKA